jgi:hypothetical protein
MAHRPNIEKKPVRVIGTPATLSVIDAARARRLF